jgi:hypothetical protein
MQQKSKETSALSRRGFIRMAGVGAGVAGAVVAGVKSEPAHAAETGTTDSSRGYRETEHVRTYYAHARG